MKKTQTQLIVEEACREASKDIRLPKCVRNGTVKKINYGKSNKQS